ncbi:TetR family transcriptional regulator [[Actinomadura] parvosata subsp. kistnae]|uniref:TetR family transcriptional regulator n=1 Tax=[Actinomadura] parvosata subsp. kistnae TaxID=1909395 RepID=A0A1U9ZRI6_9ACTN|nr:TetR/AcrR family transcriptional regulator [Nonomuraea sp. ATCC 55076]AQZ60566.1 TetR family transcriptional regulator [Nonomuraea sp. ATCC 55076]
MARSTPGVTRQRLIDEAVRLFCTRGYAATSVADIQAACGLTTGSGALYKHFPSKRALLEAAVRRNLERIAERGGETAVATGDPRADLERMARAVWEVIEQDRELIRIMLREFDGFGELFEGMWQGVMAGVYAQGARWIEEQRERGNVECADPEATAAVLLASLTYYPLLRLMIGHTPGDLGPERFLAAWAEHAAVTLRVRPHPS